MIIIHLRKLNGQATRLSETLSAGTYILRRPASPERKLQPSQETHTPQETPSNQSVQLQSRARIAAAHINIFQLLWSELSWCKAPPPRQGGARSEGFFNFGVCVSSYSYCSSYRCVWVWSIPKGGSGPVPVAHAQTQRTSEAPASRRSTRKETQTDDSTHG